MYILNNALDGMMIGFVAMLCSICALGPQNLLAIQRGVSRQQVIQGALFFIFADAALLLLAVVIIILGENVLTGNTSFYRFVGVIFLAFMGVRILENARKGNSTAHPEVGLQFGILPLIIATFANPATYFDTNGLISSLSATYQTHPAFLGFGAWVASIVWFTTLMSMAYWAGSKRIHSRIWLLANFCSGGLLLYFSWKLFINVS